MSSRKLKLAAELTYIEIKDKLITEFKLNPKAYTYSLVDSHNNEQQFQTLREYYDQQQRKYSGATRLYIGVKNLWDGWYADMDFTDVQQLLRREIEESHRYETEEMVDVPDDSMLYHKCTKLLRFAHDNGKTYERHRAWADFYIVPKADLKGLDDYEEDPDCFLPDGPLVYFLRHNIHAQNVVVEDVGGGDVWKLVPAVSQQFTSWLERVRPTE